MKNIKTNKKLIITTVVVAGLIFGYTVSKVATTDKGINPEDKTQVQEVPKPDYLLDNKIKTTEVIHEDDTDKLSIKFENEQSKIIEVVEAKDAKVYKAALVDAKHFDGNTYRIEILEYKDGDITFNILSTIKTAKPVKDKEQVQNKVETTKSVNVKDTSIKKNKQVDKKPTKVQMNSIKSQTEVNVKVDIEKSTKEPVKEQTTDKKPNEDVIEYLLDKDIMSVEIIEEEKTTMLEVEYEDGEECVIEVFKKSNKKIHNKEIVEAVFEEKFCTVEITEYVDGTISINILGFEEDTFEDEDDIDYILDKGIISATIYEDETALEVEYKNGDIDIIELSNKCEKEIYDTVIVDAIDEHLECCTIEITEYIDGTISMEIISKVSNPLIKTEIRFDEETEKFYKVAIITYRDGTVDVVKLEEVSYKYLLDTSIKTIKVSSDEKTLEIVDTKGNFRSIEVVKDSNKKIYKSTNMDAIHEREGHCIIKITEYIDGTISMTVNSLVETATTEETIIFDEETGKYHKVIIITYSDGTIDVEELEEVETPVDEPIEDTFEEDEEELIEEIPDEMPGDHCYPPEAEHSVELM